MKQEFPWAFCMTGEDDVTSILYKVPCPNKQTNKQQEQQQQNININILNINSNNN